MQREKCEHQVTGEAKSTGWVIFLVFLEEFSPRLSVCRISKTLVRSASCTHTQLIHLWRLGLNRRISWNEMWRNVDQNIKKWLPYSYQTYISCQSHHEPCKLTKMVSIHFHYFFGKWGDSYTIKGRCTRVRSRVQTKHFSVVSLSLFYDSAEDISKSTNPSTTRWEKKKSREDGVWCEAGM